MLIGPGHPFLEAAEKKKGLDDNLFICLIVGNLQVKNY